MSALVGLLPRQLPGLVTGIVSPLSTAAILPAFTPPALTRYAFNAAADVVIVAASLLRERCGRGHDAKYGQRNEPHCGF